MTSQLKIAWVTHKKLKSVNAYFTMYRFQISCLNSKVATPNIKTVFLRYEIPMLKITWSQGRLIYNMGIHLLVIRNLYIEPTPLPFQIKTVYLFVDWTFRTKTLFSLSIWPVRIYSEIFRSVAGNRSASSQSSTNINFPNTPMHPCYIAQYTIQNRNVLNSVLNGALWNARYDRCIVGFVRIANNKSPTITDMAGWPPYMECSWIRGCTIYFSESG